LVGARFEKNALCCSAQHCNAVAVQIAPLLA